MIVFNLSFSSQGQDKFSNNMDVFIEELDDFISLSSDDEVKNISKNFVKIFRKKSLTNEEKNKTRNIIEALYKRNLKADPYYKSFLSSFIVINQIRQEKMLEWLNLTENSLINMSSKDFLKYCEFFIKFTGTGELRNNKKVKWTIDLSDYQYMTLNSRPYLIFKKEVDISCENSDGNFVISKVSGDFDILNDNFIGRSGEFVWDSEDSIKNNIKILMSSFFIDMKRPELISDSSSIFDLNYFNFPIKGTFKHNLVRGAAKDNFPVFKSFRKDLEILDILKDIDYVGGYTLKGSTFVADGRDDASARIIIRNNDKKILSASSSRFSIKNRVIYSTSSSVKIFIDNDSIYHPSLQFTYDEETRSLSLFRDKDGVSGASIYSSYHQMTFDPDILQWHIDENNIYIGSSSINSSSKVIFESVANYNDVLFHSLRGIDVINPLNAVSNFISVHQKDYFHASDFSQYMRKYSETQIKHYLMNLANKGFLFYDINTHIVKVQDKLFNYINANKGRVDYDVMYFESLVNIPNSTGMIVNASLDLLSKNMTISGVKDISLSDSQSVHVRPLDGNLLLGYNRDFDFSGRIVSGGTKFEPRFVIHGKNLSFSYDDFKIDLPKIDSIRISVPQLPIQRDRYGNEKLVKLKTVIQSGSGELLIDAKNNKSGLLKSKYPEFPIFKNFDRSYVYFDKPSIYDGVYNKESFYFYLDNFIIDSLESFDGRGLEFPGLFSSSDIFPNFKDTLTMMLDYSLGFIRQTPIGGFNVFGGEAKYEGMIALSNQGLQGSGTFKYLTSKTTSNDLNFLPDSIFLFGQSFILKEVNSGIEFPEISNTNIFGVFVPDINEYRVTSDYNSTDNFICFNNQAQLEGSVILKPTGLIGSGRMLLNKFNVTSNQFSYNAHWFASEAADLIIFSEEKDILFKSNNLRTRIDLDDQEGTFFSNGKGSYVEMLENKYICYIDNLHWNMDTDILSLGYEQSSGHGSKFVSIHPDQDSLSFTSKESIYDLNKNIIKVFDVDPIFVGDAIVLLPFSGLTIMKSAYIPKIDSAKIIMDKEFKYHEFNQSSINILGRLNYNASGNYTYIDEVGDSKVLFFDTIYTNEKGVSSATSQVLNINPLELGSKYLFKGSINLTSRIKDLNFDGFIKVKHDCNLNESQWFSCSSNIDPKDIKINISENLINEIDEELSLGIIASNDSSGIYTSFLSSKKYEMDAEIFSANGDLTYDKLSKVFKINSKDSVKNSILYNEEGCNMSAEGYLNLNFDFGQLNIVSLGSIDMDQNNNDVGLRIFLLLDFMFSKKALEVMSENIFEAYSDEVEFQYGNFYKKNLYKLLRGSNIDELLVDLEAFEEFSVLPKELNNTLSFTDVNFEWDKDQKAYISVGKIGLGNIKNKQLNTMLDGYIKLFNQDGKGILKIFLKTEFGDIYYFEYKNNVMYAHSTNEDFNKILIETKSKKRRAKERKGAPPYKYQYCDEDKMENFELQMKRIK